MAKPPLPHVSGAYRLIVFGLLAVLGVVMTWITISNLLRPDQDLAPVVFSAVIVYGGLTLGAWAAWRQFSIVVSEGGVAWGRGGPGRFISWSQASVRLDGFHVVVQSGRHTVKINPEVFSDKVVFWQFFTDRFPNLNSP